ncbi:hypothetical protein ACFVJI_19780 [Streptomyces sp. NPDC127584]|uniref:hypothetical protein n=1 Tax=Streptomyces sp. NPDC127584 TaxID=3345403 RepID=UPI003644E3C4
MTRLLRRSTPGDTTGAGNGSPTADEPEAGAVTTEEAGAGTAKEDAAAAGAADADEAGRAEENGEAGSGEENGGVPEGRPGRFRPATWRRAALAGAVAVLLLTGSAFFYGAHRLGDTPSARNQALTDAGATARVGGDVGEGLARIFSYTPESDDGVRRSAETVLAGRAARQYTDLFAQVRARLVEQRITLATQTVRTGVIELDGDRARLLVFLDQTSRRDGGKTTSAAAQLTVTARFQGDRWLIVDIKAR